MDLGLVCFLMMLLISKDVNTFRKYMIDQIIANVKITTAYRWQKRTSGHNVNVKIAGI